MPLSEDFEHKLGTWCESCDTWRLFFVRAFFGDLLRLRTGSSADVCHMTVGQLAKGLGSASIGELVILRQVAESRDGWSAGQGARQRLYR